MVVAELLTYGAPTLSTSAMSVLLIILLRSNSRQIKRMNQVNKKLNIIGRELILGRIVMKKEHPKTFKLCFEDFGHVEALPDLEQVFNDEEEYGLI